MNVNLKEAFDAFVTFFSKEEKTQKFEELLLVDGATKVTIEPEVAVGSAIALYDSEGTPIPAPIGSYELQDGRVIVVEVDGVIATVTEASTEEEELEDVKKPEANVQGQEAVKRLIERIEKVSEFEKQITDLTTEKDALKKETEFLHKENDELKNKFSELEKFTKETFEKLFKVESKAPAVEQKKSFNLEKEKSIYTFLNNQKV